MIRAADPENDTFLSRNTFLLDSPSSSDLTSRIRCFCARCHSDDFVVTKPCTELLGERTERGIVSG